MRQVHRRGRQSSHSAGGPPRGRSRIGQAFGLAILGWSLVGALWLAGEGIALILEMAA